jgi:hypothetical protein
MLCSDNNLERHIGHIYYINSVKYYSFDAAQVISVQTTWGRRIIIRTAR